MLEVGLLNPVDELPLVIGLPQGDLVAPGLGLGDDIGCHVLIGHGAVNVFFPDAGEVDIGAV